MKLKPHEIYQHNIAESLLYIELCVHGIYALAHFGWNHRGVPLVRPTLLLITACSLDLAHDHSTLTWWLTKLQQLLAVIMRLEAAGEETSLTSSCLNAQHMCWVQMWNVILVWYNITYNSCCYYNLLQKVLCMLLLLWMVATMKILHSEIFDDYSSTSIALLLVVAAKTVLSLLLCEWKLASWSLCELLLPIASTEMLWSVFLLLYSQFFRRLMLFAVYCRIVASESVWEYKYFCAARTPSCISCIWSPLIMQ